MPPTVSNAPKFKQAHRAVLCGVLISRESHSSYDSPLMPTTFRGLLATSLLLAFINFLLPFVGPFGETPVAVYLAGLWLFLLTFALIKYGKRGVWLFMGFPLALFWPIVFVAYSLGYIDYI
jgi:energy-coupling factor transporter transmembrane protein EcfT